MAFPTINACFVCEGARPELGGKTILLGYYGIAPHVRVQIMNFALPVQLTFVFAGGPGHGHFRVDLRITAANGATFDAQGLEGDLVSGTTVSNVFMGFNGILPGPGNYTASLLVNGAVQFQAAFGLDPAPPPPPPGRLN
jgi:hypothetical protein